MNTGRTKYVYEAKVDDRGEKHTMTFVTNLPDRDQAFSLIHRYCLDISFTLISVEERKVALELN